jgi:hypothetical protein
VVKLSAGAVYITGETPGGRSDWSDTRIQAIVPETPSGIDTQNFITSFSSSETVDGFLGSRTCFARRNPA